METEKTKLSTNKQVTVLDEVNGCYVVEYEDQKRPVKRELSEMEAAPAAVLSGHLTNCKSIFITQIKGR